MCAEPCLSSDCDGCVFCLFVFLKISEVGGITEFDLCQSFRSFSNDRSFRLHFRLEGVPVIRFYVFVFYGIQGGVYGGMCGFNGFGIMPIRGSR